MVRVTPESGHRHVGGVSRYKTWAGLAPSPVRSNRGLYDFSSHGPGRTNSPDTLQTPDSFYITEILGSFCRFNLNYL